MDSKARSGLRLAEPGAAIFSRTSGPDTRMLGKLPHGLFQLWGIVPYLERQRGAQVVILVSENVV